MSHTDWRTVFFDEVAVGCRPCCQHLKPHVLRSREAQCHPRPAAGAAAESAACADVTMLLHPRAACGARRGVLFVSDVACVGASRAADRAARMSDMRSSCGRGSVTCHVCVHQRASSITTSAMIGQRASRRSGNFRRVATRLDNATTADANFHGNFRNLRSPRARRFPVAFLEIWIWGKQLKKSLSPTEPYVTPERTKRSVPGPNGSAGAG